MNWVDTIFLIVLALGALVGFLRGFIKWAFIWGFMIIGFIIAPLLSPLILSSFSLSPLKEAIAGSSFVTVVVAGMSIAGSFVGKFLTKLLPAPIKIFDRPLGILLGAFLACLGFWYVLPAIDNLPLPDNARVVDVQEEIRDSRVKTFLDRFPDPPEITTPTTTPTITITIPATTTVPTTTTTS